MPATTSGRFLLILFFTSRQNPVEEKIRQLHDERLRVIIQADQGIITGHFPHVVDKIENKFRPDVRSNVTLILGFDIICKDRLNGFLHFLIHLSQQFRIGIFVDVQIKRLTQIAGVRHFQLNGLFDLF